MYPNPDPRHIHVRTLAHMHAVLRSRRALQCVCMYVPVSILHSRTVFNENDHPSNLHVNHVSNRHQQDALATTTQPDPIR
jgi:hypothetical protein